MIWTNITLPNRFDINTQYEDKISDLEYKISRYEKRISWYEEEFRNIFDALKEVKEITITSGKETITAVLKEKK